MDLILGIAALGVVMFAAYKAGKHFDRENEKQAKENEVLLCEYVKFCKSKNVKPLKIASIEQIKKHIEIISKKG